MLLVLRSPDTGFKVLRDSLKRCSQKEKKTHRKREKGRERQERDQYVETQAEAH